MSRVRVAIRGGLACVWTAGMVSWLYLRATTAGRLRGAEKRALLASQARTAVFHRWSRGMLRILSVRTEVVGRPPESPFVLVSNHLSYLDIVLIGAHVPAVFLSKSEVDDWPVVGALCRAAETLYIDRAAKKSLPEVIEQIRRVTEAGRGVVLFPEGTTSEGREVARFRPPLLEMAARGAIPVNYATLGYWTPVAAPPGRAFAGGGRWNSPHIWYVC